MTRRYYAVRVEGTDDYYKPNPRIFSDDKGTIDSFEPECLYPISKFFKFTPRLYYKACEEYPQIKFEVVKFELAEIKSTKDNGRKQGRK